MGKRKNAVVVGVAGGSGSAPSLVTPSVQVAVQAEPGVSVKSSVADGAAVVQKASFEDTSKVGGDVVVDDESIGRDLGPADAREKDVPVAAVLESFQVASVDTVLETGHSAPEAFRRPVGRPKGSGKSKISPDRPGGRRAFLSRRAG